MVDQVFTISASIIAELGVALLLYALFSNHIRKLWKKQRRCPRCWYDMSHTPGLTCGECGRIAKKERGLSKARPRRRLALCALLILVGAYAFHVTPDVKQRGWAAAVPDVVLIAGIKWHAELWNQGLDANTLGKLIVLDREDSLRVECSREFKHRIDENTLSPWEWTFTCWMVADLTISPDDFRGDSRNAAPWSTRRPLSTHADYQAVEWALNTGATVTGDDYTKDLRALLRDWAAKQTVAAAKRHGHVGPYTRRVLEDKTFVQILILPDSERASRFFVRVYGWPHTTYLGRMVEYDDDGTIRRYTPFRLERENGYSLFDGHSRSRFAYNTEGDAAQRPIFMEISQGNQQQRRPSFRLQFNRPVRRCMVMKPIKYHGIYTDAMDKIPDFSTGP